MKTGLVFLAGLGVGAVVALMLAPQSGKETQELLASKLKGGLDEVASQGKKVHARVKNLTNRGKESLADAIDEGKDAYRAG